MTIAQELEAQIEGGKKLMEELKASRAETEALKGQVVTLTGERDAAVKAKADADAAHVVALKASETALASEKALHVACKAELDKAQKALTNPAFAAAAAVGSKKAVTEGGSEASEASTITKENAEQEYKKIPSSDAQARADFRAKYSKELGLTK